MNAQSQKQPVYKRTILPINVLSVSSSNDTQRAQVSSRLNEKDAYIAIDKASPLKGAPHLLISDSPLYSPQQVDSGAKEHKAFSGVDKVQPFMRQFQESQQSLEGSNWGGNSGGIQLVEQPEGIHFRTKSVID